MPIVTYNCTDLTGGGTRALDAISVADLHNGDRAIVADASDQFRYFEFQEYETDAEDSSYPAKIRPDDYSSAGVWYEQAAPIDIDDSTDNHVARYSGVDGLQGSYAVIDDSGQLSLYNSGDTRFAYLNDSEEPFLIYQDLSSVACGFCLSDNTSESGNKRWQFSARPDSASNKLNFSWYSGSDWTTVMTLLTDGKVGIGTSSPNIPVGMILSSGGTEVGFTQGQVGGNATLELCSYDGSNLTTRFLIRGNAADSDMEFYTGVRGSETCFLFLDASAQSVSIGNGTTAAQAKLQVTGGAILLDNTRELNFKDTSGNTTTYSIRVTNSNRLTFKTNNSDRMYINSNGYVGIGIAPSYKFDIQAGGNETALRIITNSDAGTRANIVIDSGYNRDVGICFSNQGTHIWQLANDGAASPNNCFCLFDDTVDNNVIYIVPGCGANRIYINADGDVGIATNSPGAQLDVTGDLILENGVAVDEFSSDGTLAGDSDLAVPTEKAVKTYVDTRITLSGVVTSTATVSNTAVETTLGTVSLPANSMVASHIMDIEINGVISNNSASDDVTVKVYIGSTEIASYKPAIGNVSSAPWHMDQMITIRSIGATGSLAVHGHLEINGNEDVNNSIETIDTTAVQDITLTVTWDNAKADNVFSMYQGRMLTYGGGV